MIGIGISNSIGAYRSFVDPAASAFFAATGITGTTEQQAVNNLVTSLKSAGLWSKMKAVYPFVTDNRNLLSYTEDFGNAVWSKNSATVTTNTATAPNGTTTADTFTLTPSGDSSVYQSINGVSNNYTTSVYAKYVSGDKYLYIFSPLNSQGAKVWFDIQNGTVSNQVSGFVGTIENVGNGWYRCSVYNTIPSVSNYIQFGISTTNSSRTLSNNSVSYFWGAQLELGSTATTYQPIATTQQSYISNQFKYNLVNPVDSDAAFRGVFNGGWTFSNQGALPNGVNGYMDTKLLPSSVLALNNAHLSFYSRTNNISDNYDIGCSQAVYQYLLGLSLKGDVVGSYNFVNDLLPTSIVAADSLGLQTISRITSSEVKINKNALSRQTLTKNSIQIPAHNLFIGALNLGGTAARFSNRQTAFSSIGDGLTDTEATALYNAVQTFNSTLQRQVV